MLPCTDQCDRPQRSPPEDASAPLCPTPLQMPEDDARIAEPEMIQMIVIDPEIATSQAKRRCSHPPFAAVSGSVDRSASDLTVGRSTETSRDDRSGSLSLPYFDPLAAGRPIPPHYQQRRIRVRCRNLFQEFSGCRERTGGEREVNRTAQMPPLKSTLRAAAARACATYGAPGRQTPSIPD